jgi:hypothetical protein
MANGELKLVVVQTPATGVAVKALDRNDLRDYLLIQNIGESDITIGFDPSVMPENGIMLAPGVGGQGGFFLWQDTFIPTNAIYVASAAASSVAVLEG